MTTKNPLITIIIPCYNRAYCLNKCLYSISKQTVSSWECIIIDDGSLDNTSEVVRKWIDKDHRFIYLEQENKGPSAARNLGIKEAKGEWLIFIDSDDWVEPNHLEDIINDIEEGIDFIMHGRYGGKKFLKYKNEVEIIERKDVQTLFNELKLTPNGQICSKLFKTDIIKSHHIEFIPKIKMSEDVLFILSYLSKLDIMKYRDCYTYHYESNSDSLSKKTKRDFDSNLLGFEIINQLVYDEFKIKSLKGFSDIELTVTKFLERAVSALAKNGYSKKERIEAYKKILSVNKFENLNVGNSKYVQKMYPLLFNGKLGTFDFFAKERYRVTLLYRVINKFYNLTA